MAGEHDGCDYTPRRQRRLVLTAHRASDCPVFTIELAGVQEYDLDDEPAAAREMARIARSIADDVLGAELRGLQAAYSDRSREFAELCGRVNDLELQLDKAVHERRRALAHLSHAADLTEQLLRHVRSLMDDARR